MAEHVMTGGAFFFLRSFTREPQERGSCALNPLEFHDVETREPSQKKMRKKKCHLVNVLRRASTAL